MISRWNIEKQAYSKNRDVMVMEKYYLMKQVPKRDLLFTYSLIQQDVLTTADFKATVQTPFQVT